VGKVLDPEKAWDQERVAGKAWDRGPALALALDWGLEPEPRARHCLMELIASAGRIMACLMLI
jgi:hypothetical protein